MAENGLQTFYRELHVNDPRLAARRFLATNFGLRCPACAGAKVTKGPLGVIDRCPACGSRFDRFEGNETISIPLSFFITVVVLLTVSLIVIPRYGFFDGLMVALAGVGVGMVLLLVRPARVLTLWMLWMLGFVYPDRMTEKGRRVLPAREEDDPVTYDLREPAA